MARPRWLSPWKNDPRALVRYHVVNRVVDRRMVFGPAEREKFRSLLRRYETFSGCRVLTYCILSNHFHILLEVPPAPPGGIPEDEFFRRLGALYSKARVAALRAEIEDRRRSGHPAAARDLIEAHAYRMHDLSEFMKGLTQRFSVWFNRTRGRTGRLWEERFKSLIVEGGAASRAVAAYIDLNPVRAGLAADPAAYRWCGYGEAVAASGDAAARARGGLVRALRGHVGQAVGPPGKPAGPGENPAAAWDDPPSGSASRSAGPGPAPVRGGVAREYRRILAAALGEPAGAGDAADSDAGRDLAIGRIARHRVRHFTDGAVLGGRAFVDGIFEGCRERFGPKRKSGARKPRGALAALRGTLWSFRDLQVDTG